MLSSAKVKFIAKDFSAKPNFDESAISLPVFFSRTNPKLYNTTVTSKMANIVITNLDFLKASSPDCIPVVVLQKCEKELSYILTELFNKSKCLIESLLLDCWKLSSVVPECKNIGEKSTAKKPTALLV